MRANETAGVLKTHQKENRCKSAKSCRSRSRRFRRYSKPNIFGRRYQKNKIFEAYQKQGVPKEYALSQCKNAAIQMNPGRRQKSRTVGKQRFIRTRTSHHDKSRRPKYNYTRDECYALQIRRSSFLKLNCDVIKTKRDKFSGHAAFFNTVNQISERKYQVGE